MNRNTHTPLRSIREKCLDCCCGSAREVKLCPSQECSLYPFRFGHNPARAGIGGKGNNSEKPDSIVESEQKTENRGGVWSA